MADLTKHCEECGKTFTADIRAQHARYCSPKCARRMRNRRALARIAALPEAERKAKLHKQSNVYVIRENTAMEEAKMSRQYLAAWGEHMRRASRG